MSADMTTKSEVEGKKYATVTSSYSGIGKGGGFRTTGEQSDRLTFQHVPSGRSTVPICANVRTYAGSKGSASPVEIKYSLVGRPVTRADLKADPSALSSPGGKEAIDDGPSEAPAKQSGSGSDGGTADRAERAESAGSSTELASPLVLGGTLALALLAGIAARLLTNRRRTR
jgi:hypothetical protein